MATLLGGIQKQNESLWSVCWIPDGSRLLIASGGRSLSIWEFFADNNPKCLAEHRESSLGIVSISAIEKGDDIHILASCLDGHIRVYSYQESRLLNDIFVGTCWQITCSGDNVATGNQAGEVMIYNVTSKHPKRKDGTSEPVKQFDGECNNFILSAQYSPNGETLAVGYAKGKDKAHPYVCIYDAETGEQRKIIQGCCDSIRHLHWVGKYLFAASQDLRVHIMDVEEGKTCYQMSGHRGWVTSVSVSPDQQRVASVSTDGRLKIWEISKGECTTTCQNHEGPVWDCAYSPTGRHLATVAEDGFIYCYSIPQI